MKADTPETDACFPSPKLVPDETGVWVQIGRLRNLERQRNEVRALARELRDALGIALNQWRGNAEANGEDRDLENEQTLEASMFQVQQKILAKAKEVLP
jgi:hypothetical protein